MKTQNAARNIEPRVIGGTYFGGYWRQAYTVLALTTAAGILKRITVRWEDGTTTTHCTAWDPKRDRVITEPKCQASDEQACCFDVVYVDVPAGAAFITLPIYRCCRCGSEVRNA